MKARWQLVLAAVCFSTAGAVIKLSTFGAWQIAAFRALIAMLAINLLAGWGLARRARLTSPEPGDVSPRP